jgi:hypothetical protein
MPRLSAAWVADGTIQLLAPAQVGSMLQETGFAMDLTRVVGPIILACAILYAIPATATGPAWPGSSLVRWSARMKSPSNWVTS